MPRRLLPLLFPLLLAACDRAHEPDAAGPLGVETEHDHASHAGSGHEGEGLEEGGAAPAPAVPGHGQGRLHGQDGRGLVFVDPQDPDHPGTVQMGAIPLGELREATVRIRNAEAAPITITQLTAGCSCTLPEISYLDASGAKVTGRPRSSGDVLTIPPGVTADLVLRVDSKLAPIKNKDKNVIVRITTDSDLDPYLSVEARMKIEAPFQCAPPELALARVGANAGAVGQVELAPVGDDGRRITAVLSAPQGVEATLEKSPRQGIETWIVTARVVPPVSPGYQEGTIRLSTTGPGGEGEARPYDVRITWNGVPDVEVVPTRLLFLRNPGKQSELAEVEIVSHMTGHWFRVTKHTLEGAGTENLAVVVAPVFPDPQGRTGRWRISLEPKTDLGPGAIEGQLTVELDDPQYPSFQIPIVRKAQPAAPVRSP